MTLTLLSTAIGLAAAALLGLELGAARGTGVLAGYVAGAAVTGFFLVRQRRVLRAAPQRALLTMAEGFLAKLGSIVVATLAILFVPGLRGSCDLASFLLAFAAAVLLVLLPGTFENARVLRERRAE